MEETFTEFQEFVQDELDSYTKQVYEKTKAKLEKLKPLEETLVRIPCLPLICSYIKGWE